MTDEDRILLAEAMGYVPTTIYTGPTGRRHVTQWRSPSGKSCRIDDLPDPENDANGDYAVLKWMRHFNLDTFVPSDPDNVAAFHKWEAFVLSLPDDPIEYEVGDYARAAVKALEEDRE